MNNSEEWKVYQFGESFDETYHLYFSKYGEVKSFTKNNPEGKILKGSLREGYPIISFTQFKPITESVKANFDEQAEHISELRTEARELKKIIKKKSTAGKDLQNAVARIEELAKEIKSRVSRLSRQRQKDLKSRALYYHLLVHKAVAELFIPNDDPENKKFVIHKNFDKKDNRVENLSWATKDEVVKRSFESPKFISYKISKPKKDPTSVSKLSYNEVVLIKRKLKKGEPAARLARRFGVSDMQIHRIKTGENWSDVQLSLINNKS